MDTKVSKQDLADFLEDQFLRQFALEKTDNEGGDRRVLPHLHFTGWPDKGVPEHLDSLIG